MSQFTGSTLSSYSSKWLIGIGVMEVLLSFGFAIGTATASGGAFGLGLTAAILGVVGIVLIAIGLRVRRHAEDVDRVETTGLAGQATITGMTQTGMFLNENPQIELELSVQLPDRPPYTAQHKEFVPMMLLGQIGVGKILPVKVDPADQSKVVIDWGGSVPEGGTGGWWSTAGAAGAPAGAGGAGSGETLQQVAQALSSSAAGAGAAKPFEFAEQGNYTVDQLRQYVRTHGIEGTATIDRLDDTGKIVGDEHMFLMQVTVNVPGQPPHQTAYSAAMVPIAAASKVAVGKTLPVMVARDNPDLVTFEWEKI